MNKNNKKPKVKETDINENRHSRSNDMVGDMTEVTQLLCEAVQKQNNSKHMQISLHETFFHRKIPV